MAEDEAVAVKKLQQQKGTTCYFRNNQLMHDRYYKLGIALMGFWQNKNGDFRNSDFLMVENGNIVGKREIIDDSKIQLYDEKGKKLFDKTYAKIYYGTESCEKTIGLEGLSKYDILPINATGKNAIKYAKNTTQDFADLERLSKRKFYLENKNSSKIKIFSPFGYMMEYGSTLVDGRAIKAFNLYDIDGNLLADDITGYMKINDSRFTLQTVKPSAKNPAKKEIMVSLFDANNKSLFTAYNMKPNTESESREKYDLLVFYKDGKSALVDFDGNIVIDFQDKYIFRRSYNGLIVYASAKPKPGGYNLGLLNLQLKPIIDSFLRIDFRDDFVVVYQKDKVVIFDYAGNMLHDLKADRVTFNDKFFIATLKNESTLYNYRGEKLFDRQYDSLTSIGNDTFAYKINGKMALIDINAKEIIPPVCENIKSSPCGVIECYIGE